MRSTHSRMMLTLAAAVALAGPTLAQNQAPPPPPANGPSTVNITTPGPAQVTVQVTPAVPAPPPPAKAKPNPEPIPEGLGDPNLQGFAAAYQASGDPRLLVLVGIDSRPVNATIANLRLGAAAIANSNGKNDAANQHVDQAVAGVEKSFTPTGQVATGKGLDGGFIGQNMSLFDPAGDALILRSSIEEWLHRVRDVDLVSLEGLSERDRRELSLLGMRDEKQAMDLLAQKLNADVVLVVRMLNNGYVRDRGAMWRVSVETIQVGRGRKIGGFAFEWTEGVDSYTIKRYAQEITRKFIDQYIGFYTPGPVGPAQRYAVRLLGLNDANDVVRARQAFAKISGMERVTGGEFSSAAGASVATMSIFYAGGPLELMVELQNAANQALGMNLTGTDAATGTITLIAGPNAGAGRKPAPAPVSASPVAPAATDGSVPAAPPAPVAAMPPAATAPASAAPATPAAVTAERPRWQLFVDPADPRSKPVRDAFLNAYKEQGMPKIVVVVARALNDTEKLQPVAAKQIKDFLAKHPAVAGSPTPGGVFVASDLSGGVSSPGAGAGLLDVAHVERAVAQHLGRIGVTVIDPAAAREALRQGEGKTRDIFDADDLVLVAGKAAGADVVVQGIGRPDPAGPAGATSYTFRAVRVSDGVALAAEGWFTEPAPAAGTSTEQAFQNIGSFAAGKMADQMLASWSAPRSTTVTVQNAKTQKDIFTLMSALKTGLPMVDAVDFIKHDAANGGTGSFSLRYRGSYDALIAALGEQEKKLPMAVVKEKSSPEAVTVKIKDAI